MKRQKAMESILLVLTCTFIYNYYTVSHSISLVTSRLYILPHSFLQALNFVSYSRKRISSTPGKHRLDQQIIESHLS